MWVRIKIINNNNKHICIHIHLYIYVVELLTHSYKHVLFDVYNNPSGWKESYLNSYFAVKTLSFKEIYGHH